MKYLSIKSKAKRAKVLFAFVFAFVSVSAQSLSYGIDPARDTAAFALFNTHMDSIRSHHPTVALVLSGGGAKGAAHVSVIKYLDSIGLHPDLVVGTSIGGLVGGLYACGYTGKQLEEIFLSQHWDTLLRDLRSPAHDALDQKDLNRRILLTTTFGEFNNDFFSHHASVNLRRKFMGGGVVQGQNIYNLLSTLTIGYADERNFLEMPTPFVCVASDMVSASPKVWHSGYLLDALRSTMSIPALFTPVKQDSMVLLDGAMRDNFPVDVARALGADIVIGVDISAPPLKADEINTLLDIVAQTTDVLGRETYEIAKRSTDIYIKPDLQGFSLLSFRSQDILQMMARGDDAVRQHATELNAVVSGGCADLPPAHIPDSIDIAAVCFVGVGQKAEAQLKQLLSQQVTGRRSRVTIRDIQESVDIMMGTKAFETVTYQLLGPRPPYILQFTCKPSAIHQLGVGLRFDSKDLGAILLHVGLNTQSLTGSQLRVEGRLGQRSALTADYALRTRQGWDFGANLAGEYVRNGGFTVEQQELQAVFGHARAETFLHLTRWKDVNIRAGVFLDYWRLFSLLTDPSIARPDFLTESYQQLFPALFAQLRSDSYDDPYFPTRGVRSHLLARLFLPALLEPSGLFCTLEGNLQGVLAAGPVAWMPYAGTRYLSQYNLPYINALAVQPAGRVLEQQMVFVGLNDATTCQRLVATAGLDMRFRLVSKHYLTLKGQVLHQSDELKGFFLRDDSRTDYGFGLEYSYQTVLGPLRAQLHWSTFSRRPGALVGIGLDF